MYAIAVSQPWAWLIVNGIKDIENRSWKTKIRGRVLIHASKKMYKEDIDDARRLLRERRFKTYLPGGKIMPLPDTFDRGGIVGSVEIVDCVTVHKSPWFEKQWYQTNYGFVLENAEPLPFRAIKGYQKFFHVDFDALYP